MRTLRTGLAGALGLLLALALTPAMADVVHLKDGRKLEGETRWTADGLEIKMKMGTMVVARKDVVRIEEGETPQQEYKRRNEALDPEDLPGAVDLARFCIDNEMAQEGGRLLLRAVSLGAGASAEAATLDRKALLRAKAMLGELDYHEVDGRWVPPEEYYPARGYVRKRGKWVLKEKPAEPAEGGGEKEPLTSTTREEGGEKTTGEPTHSRLVPEALSERVVFVIDSSGSMLIGERWVIARDRMYEIVDGLPAETEFDVIFFHDKQSSLYGKDFLRAKEKTKKRLRKHMKGKGVRLEAGTDLDGALANAIARGAGTIVLFTDGIPTAGKRTDPRKILEAVAERREQAKGGPPAIFVLGVLEGEFMNPKVEKKDAARAFLQKLAGDNGGSYEELKDPRLSPPLGGTDGGGRGPEITVHYYKSRQKITSIRLGAAGFFPAFHMKVEDAGLGHGDFRILEYPAKIALRVESYDERGNQVDQPTEIPFQRKGNTIVSTHYLRVTGPIDNQEDHGSHLDKRVYIKAFTGGNLQVIYTRGDQEFQKGLRVTSGKWDKEGD